MHQMMMQASEDEVKLDSQGGASPVMKMRGNAYQSQGGDPPAAASAYDDDEAGAADMINDEQQNIVMEQNMFDPKLANMHGNEIEAGQALPDVNGTFPMQSLNAISGSASRASIPRSNAYVNATYFS